MSARGHPLALLAELTYVCPLRCPYCSNPVWYPDGAELSTAEWQSVLTQAGEMGVLHVGFSGGEPLLRRDIVELISVARSTGLYTNLITSGMGLNTVRCRDLKLAGLDSLQLSLQADEPSLADRIAGVGAHEKKLAAAKAVCDGGIPLSLNVVLHQANLERIEALISLAEDLHAHRLELAHAQYYGWAFRNREALLAERTRVDCVAEIVAREAKRLNGRLKIVYVQADYHSDFPKPCMNGWGRTHLTVNPFGAVLPCPNAPEIPGMKFENVRDRPMKSIWEDSSAFNRFRGQEWMREPCRSCERREMDFGGCRCQAALLTGDAASTDPACSLSPFRSSLPKPTPAETPWIHRDNPMPQRQV
jgi:pyrroloquinoline quinone biosynthesis protein E